MVAKVTAAERLGGVVIGWVITVLALVGIISVVTNSLAVTVCVESGCGDLVLGLIEA